MKGLLIWMGVAHNYLASYLSDLLITSVELTFQMAHLSLLQASSSHYICIQLKQDLLLILPLNLLFNLSWKVSTTVNVVISQLGKILQYPGGVLGCTMMRKYLHSTANAFSWIWQFDCQWRTKRTSLAMWCYRIHCISR